MATDTQLWIKPVEGRSLPREASRARITGPTPVPNTAYYRRALVRGDVVKCDPTQEAAQGPAEQGKRVA